MDSAVGALRASVDRLHTLASGLDDARVTSPSYCDDWSIAQVLSHLGSGAVILQRSLEDVRAGTTTPEDFNPSVWDEWNAKSPRAQADDALAADEAVTRAIEAVDESERARLVFHLGPMSLSFDDYVGMRLNEHAFHTWDIAAALDAGAHLSDDEAALVVDNLGRIVAFSGRSDGQERTITVHTTDPRAGLRAALLRRRRGAPRRRARAAVTGPRAACGGVRPAGLRPPRCRTHARLHGRRGAARLAAHCVPRVLSRRRGDAPQGWSAGGGQPRPSHRHCRIHGSAAVRNRGTGVTESLQRSARLHGTEGGPVRNGTERWTTCDGEQPQKDVMAQGREGSSPTEAAQARPDSRGVRSWDRFPS